MAQHSHPSVLGCGDPGRYFLRTEKHCETFRDLESPDLSQITSKEEFLRSMGLQMRNAQHEYKPIHNTWKTMKINIPPGVKLRPCSVVIPGVTCDVCGRRFKCESDVKVHHMSRHRNYEDLNNNVSTAKQRTDAQIEKPHRKRPMKRLILKIGDEIIARRDVRRKYLSVDGVDLATRLKYQYSNRPVRRRDESRVSIDSTHSLHDFCDCVAGTLRTKNTTDQYFHGNIVPGRRAHSAPITSQTERQDEEVGSVREDRLHDENPSSPAAQTASGVSETTNAFSKTNGEASNQMRSLERPTESQPPSLPGPINVDPKPGRPVAVSGFSTQTSTDQHCDDVQEVLRIVRRIGKSCSKEINHESPNRSERQLLMDAINDMRRMEDQGLHLEWNNDTDRLILNLQCITEEVLRESSPNLQRFDNGRGQRPLDTSKKNASHSWTIPSTEELKSYGINYYNDSFDLYENSENVRESDSRHLLAQCSAGREAMRSAPFIVID